MARDAGRGLTDGERALARAVFAAHPFDPDRVRLRHGAGANPAAAIALRVADAVTMIDTIHFREPPPADFSAGGNRLLFLHELTHAWQYQRLGAAGFYARYLREWARCGFRRKDMYVYASGDPFGQAMLEAQAEMVRDYSRDAAGKAKAGPSLAGSGLYGL